VGSRVDEARPRLDEMPIGRCPSMQQCKAKLHPRRTNVSDIFLQINKQIKDKVKDLQCPDQKRVSAKGKKVKACRTSLLRCVVICTRREPLLTMSTTSPSGITMTKR
jgi:hypothetical protein